MVGERGGGRFGFNTRHKYTPVRRRKKGTVLIRRGERGKNSLRIIGKSLAPVFCGKRGNAK